MDKNDRITFYGSSNKGCKPSHNEDFYLIDSQKGIFLVADGIGGYNYGEVASRAACELFTMYFNPETHDIEAHMREILIEINTQLYQQGAAKGQDMKMGTTFLAGALSGSGFHLSHVGDVRAYLLRRGRLKQLTRDHTTVAEMVSLGFISPEEAESHPLKHVINRSLGTQPDISPDYHQLDIKSGDKLLLCSDGLWNEVDDTTLKTILKMNQSPEQTVAQLIETANNNGGKDNITALVISVLNDRIK